MSDILKDFYQNYSNSPEDIILHNCKNFLLYKSMSPCVKNSRPSQKKKKQSFLISQINMFNSKDRVKLKLVDLSRINGRNKKNRLFDNVALNNIYKSNNLKGKYRTCDEKLKSNKSRNEILDKVIKNFDYPMQNNNKMRKTQSAKNIENNKNMTQKIINNKVKLIIKDLLSKDSNQYKIKEEYSRNFFPLKNSINPMKYIEYNMQNEPNNPKLYKSYFEQIKYLRDKNIRNFLIEGINDYHENLKKYREINFDYFSKNNNNRKKFYQKKIKEILLKGQIKGNKSTKYTNLKYNDLIYNSKKDNFKNNYIKAYNEKNFSKSKNLYIKYMNNNEIKKMLSLDDKMKLAYSSTKNLMKSMKKDTLQKFKKKYIL